MFFGPIDSGNLGSYAFRQDIRGGAPATMDGGRNIFSFGVLDHRKRGNFRARFFRKCHRSRSGHAVFVRDLVDRPIISSSMSGCSGNKPSTSTARRRGVESRSHADGCSKTFARHKLLYSLGKIRLCSENRVGGDFFQIQFQARKQAFDSIPNISYKYRFYKGQRPAFAASRTLLPLPPPSAANSGNHADPLCHRDRAPHT